jgi:endonuclease/exonuclease/phosphatase family metal-dependent hydrolase
MAILGTLVTSCQCSISPLHSQKEICVISYNVHNLFDAEESGNEYVEFKPSKGKWTKELYAKRLANTVKAVRSTASEGRTSNIPNAIPDILCLQEIENDAVLVDLAAQFGKGAYRYWAIAGPEASTIHTGVLSRFPIISMRTHAVEDSWGFGPTRDLLELEFDCGSLGNIVMFACHWKSKTEGAAETESARRAAAALLVGRIRALQSEKPLLPIVVCGDFNESPDEYIRVDRAYQTGIMPLEIGVLPDAVPDAVEGELLWVSNSWQQIEECQMNMQRDVTLYNPWSEMPLGYSIAYKDKREQFDSFFINSSLKDGKGMEYEQFSVAVSPDLFGIEGVPLSWTGTEGYSDHLPVMLRLRFEESAK